MLVNAIHDSTRRGSYTELKRLLQQPDFDPSMLVLKNTAAMKHSGLRLPPLHHAALHGQCSELRLMLDHHVTDDTVDCPHDDLSPLLLAVRSRCVHCVEALLCAGADPNFNIDPAAMTPLQFAVGECSNPDIARLLLEFGAEPMLETRYASPVQFAASRLAPACEEREHWEAMLEMLSA